METNDHAPLVGEAVGDALGMAFETMRPDDDSLTSWDGSTYHPSEYHGLRPGQWTDDTMMAKIITESLVTCGGYYPRDVADRYLAWYRSGNHRGMGKATREALERILNGTPWNRSGVEGAEGNGTAMRAAPLGFFFHEDLVTTREFAQMDARITHRSLEAEMGSVAVALGVALLLNKVEPKELVEKVVEHLADSNVKLGLEKITFYQRQGGVTAAEALRIIGTRAHVTQTVPAAFAAFTMTSSYEETVRVAIRAGGDTDTTAAIAGALAGTFYGINAIPKAWKDNLEDFHHLRRLETKIARGPRSDALWRL